MMLGWGLVEQDGSDVLNDLGMSGQNGGSMSWG